MTILNYLGQPTKTGHVFTAHLPLGPVNDLLQLSADTYTDKLYNAVVEGMSLSGPSLGALPSDIDRRIRQKNAPSATTYPVRSREFETKLDFIVRLTDAHGRLAGVFANAKPVNGYHYESGKGIDDRPITAISHPEFRAQAHNWETLVTKNIQGSGYSLIGLLMAAQLSQERGAEHVTAYASTFAVGDASIAFVKKLQQLIPEMRLLETFSMFDERNEVENHGQLVALPLRASEKSRAHLENAFINTHFQ